MTLPSYKNIRKELFHLVPVEGADWTNLLNEEDNFIDPLLFLKAEGFSIDEICSHLLTIHPDVKVKWNTNVRKVWNYLNGPGIIISGRRGDIGNVYANILDHSGNSNYPNIIVIENEDEPIDLKDSTQVKVRIEKIRDSFNDDHYQSVKITFDNMEGATAEIIQSLIIEFKDLLDKKPTLTYHIL